MNGQNYPQLKKILEATDSESLLTFTTTIQGSSELRYNQQIMFKDNFLMVNPPFKLT